MRVWLYSALVCLSLGCNSNRLAKVEGILVPQADGLVAATDGETLAITPANLDPPLSDASTVRLAIAREVTWAQVRSLHAKILDADKNPVLLVASERKVGAIELYEELQGEAIQVTVTAEGKLCVAPLGSREAKCVERADRRHVDRSFTRELVREAVRAYGLHDVLIHLPPDIQWADAVRAIDGARTCCFKETVRVRLKDERALGKQRTEPPAPAE